MTANIVVMHRRTLWLAVLLLFPAAVQRAGDSALDRATLRGLKAVYVVIDLQNPDAERDGLTKDALRARIEERLAAADIPLDAGANEFVGLRVPAAHDKKGTYALSLTLALYQPVILSRNKEVRTATQTWDAETVVLAPPKLLLDSAMAETGQLADLFAAAYRSVNPK